MSALIGLLLREWGFVLLIWVAVYLLLCFFVRTKRVCAAYQKYPVVAGKRVRKERRGLYKDPIHAHPGYVEDSDDAHEFDREDYLNKEVNSDGYWYGWGLIWPVTGPVALGGYLIIVGLAGFLLFFDAFTKATGRSCAEAKSCKLKGD